MNERQKRFVEYYIQTGNSTQSAIRAGYSAKNADVTGPRLLGNVGIAAAIKERLGSMDKKIRADTDEAMAFVTAVMRGEVTEKLLTNKGDVKELPLRGADRLAAADKILRVNGAYKDKVEVEMSFAEKYMAAMEKIASS